MKDSIASILLAKLVYVVCLMTGEISVKGIGLVVFFGVISGGCGYIGNVLTKKCFIFFKSFFGYIGALYSKYRQ